ncbi:DUF2306 domain-containing protein [Simiduia aestuariiviva]|uniref:DUF2306 domain-containing protein n=1 Tax=Simiduia aestuariiviva TaxID=1510459 RepID=A0A839ULF4_9GAMM|nr:DUF2306 domain-containing protein [Simiduia aestuariiviva]MBB3167399.1 hypothetical protein [Simiduia aestuariiviva]
MSDIALQQQIMPRIQLDRIVPMAVTTWFSIAAVGHWIFCVYIVAAFFPPIAENGMQGLKGMHLPSGFNEGDFIGNIAAISHVLLASIIIGGGPLQLIPAVRNRFPRFHRVLGRCYLVAAVTSALVGLYMTWTRSAIGDVISHIGISGDAVLILVCALMAVRHAMARRFVEHRRWALRLFLVASAVWFSRVGLMGWVMLTGGVGVDFKTFTGPFLYFLGFANYLLPLGMLQWYFHCQQGAAPWVKSAFVVSLGLLTIYMAVGIFAATMGLWLPRM